MPSYKLTYFNVRARAELSRYIFHAAGKDFQDVRMKEGEWAEFKKSTPFGQVPLLEVDGKPLAQSNSIARFLAKEFDLAGKTNWEQGQTDQYIELLEDMLKEVVSAHFEKDEEKKKELQKVLTEETFPKFLGYFEKALTANGGTYLVGGALTVADLAVYNSFETPLTNMPTLMDTYPKLKAHRALVEAYGGIGKYIKKREKTAF